MKRLASEGYWSSLGSWGIRKISLSQDAYFRSVDAWYKQWDELKKEMKESEAEVKLDASSLGHIWHAGLPDAPAGFPKEADFALTRSEAEFLRDCICESHGDSFLAYLANHGIPDPSIPFPWLAPDRDMYTEAHKRLLYHAHLFSTVMHGASIAYNYFLACYADSKERIDKYYATFAKWVQTLPNLHDWSIEELFAITQSPEHRISSKTQDFVRFWVQCVRDDVANCLSNADVRSVIRGREHSLKGARSRFYNERSLKQWGGKSGMNQFDYRWPTAKKLLADLFRGLEKVC